VPGVGSQAGQGLQNSGVGWIRLAKDGAERANEERPPEVEPGPHDCESTIRRYLGEESFRHATRCDTVPVFHGDAAAGLPRLERDAKLTVVGLGGLS
jgi:hypothetical protein